MADNNSQLLTSTRLWSEEVAIAAADDPDALRDPNKEPGYEFSGGRRFDSGPGAYAVTTTTAP